MELGKLLEVVLLNGKEDCRTLTYRWHYDSINFLKVNANLDFN